MDKNILCNFKEIKLQGISRMIKKQCLTNILVKKLFYIETIWQY